MAPAGGLGIRLRRGKLPTADDLKASCQELASEERLIDSKTVEAEYAEEVAQLARRK